MQAEHQKLPNKQSCLTNDPQDTEHTTVKTGSSETENVNNLFDEDSKESNETILPCNGNDFLKRFSSEERATVSHLFHQWAKKAAFKEPKRLLDKVAFVIDERLRVKKTAQKVTHFFLNLSGAKITRNKTKNCLKSKMPFSSLKFG
ncbi:putative DNA helicase [Helianthus anomalus]